jgi:phosphoserine aminotransferase
MANRIYNFSAGPAVLPAPVLEKAAQAVGELDGTGMSILEISHRSKEFSTINHEAQERFARLTGLTGTHKILFLQGGASQQFAAVPMNLMPAGGTADYVITGAWAKKAVKEAGKFGTGRVAASSEEDGFTRIPEQSEIDRDPAAAYLHYTSNNTIFGTQYSYVPDAGDTPLVCDASSDILSHRLDFAGHALIYAGAQKNLGPAGVTIVAVREDMLERSPANLPTVLSYTTHAAKESLYNTPPTFSVFVVGLVLEWIEAEGGLDAMEKQNRAKAARLYGAIDGSGFYRGTAAEGSRSIMNVTFRLPSEDLEKMFIAHAAEQGMSGLKGHRSVGGCRASIYNAFPPDGVDVLIDFMKEFERSNG